MGSEVEISQMDYKGLIEESAEDLYENAPCGYLTTLPNGTIVKINRTLLDWVGYEREELLHKRKFQDLLPIGGKMYYETHYAPLLRMQGFANEINFDLKGKHKQELPVLVNTIQVRDKDGKPLLNRTTIFNITDRKKYEQELLRAKKEAEEAAKVKAEFLSTVSHEIRTPLNAIVTIANLLQGMRHSEEQEEYFKTLKLSADNLLHLINDILDYSKIEAGRIELAERPVSLKDLVHSLLYSLSITAEAKGLAVKLDLDERLPEYVTGDPVKIGQVLTNLLSNAIKFTEKGHVALKLRVMELTAEDVCIDFLVEDTGIGIEQDKLNKIFQEFTQADYEINLKYGGTGLGLAISQKIVSLYSSRISVTSELGKGTTFSFSLRLGLAEEAHASSYLNDNDVETTIEGVRILLVDDNPVNVLVVSKYLDKWGVDYQVAQNGLEAVEMVQQHRYELVLMDLQMPDMDGYEATSKIRSFEDEQYRQLPIIALSASTRFDYRERMEVVGINDFVSKPFKAKELHDMIARYTRAAALRAAEETPDDQRNDTPDQLGMSPEPDGPDFSLDAVAELLEDNEQDLEELVRMTIRNFQRAKTELQEALLQHDLKDYRFCNHRIKMTVDLLQAAKLTATLDRGRNLLEQEEPDEDTVQEVAVEIGHQFDTVLQGLVKVLSERWQRDYTL